MRKIKFSIYSYLLPCILCILWTVTLSNPLTLPLNPTKGLNFYGLNSAFGYSVSRAGDINGDGVDDIVVGSPNEVSLSGIVYVVYGSKTGPTDLSPSALATLSATGKGFLIQGFPGGQLGFSVSGAGDVNGDGIEDIVMGAPLYNSNAGYIYVIFGSKTGLRDFNLATDYASGIGFGINGPSGSYFGYSVSGIGDINGDGIDDIIIGAPLYNTFGAAYVIYGKTTRSSSLALTGSEDLVTPNFGFLITAITVCSLGYSVSGAGDVNGDGVPDVVVGAYYYNSGNGYAAVVFGSKSQLSDLPIVPGSSPSSSRGYIISCLASIQLGLSVSGAGDINGDGLADVIIGGKVASFTSPTVTNGGAVFVIYGSRALSSGINLGSALTISPSVGFRITCGVSHSFLGTYVSNTGDLNGDGVDDIILGASGSTGQSTSGAVYVIYGNKAGLGNIDGITPTNFVDSTIGFVISPIYMLFSVGWGGDFNGDSGPEMLIGGLNNSTTLGGTYVYFGTPRPSLDPSEIATLNAMTQALVTAGKAIDAAVTSISIINFSNPGAAILKSITETVYFIKYLNISYPPKLQYVLDTYQSEDIVTIDNFSSAPQGIVDKMERYTLPQKFEKYDDTDGFHSSFLINFWQCLITLSVILFFVLVTCVFKPCASYSGGGSKTRRFIQWLYAKSSQIMKWNFMFSKFTGYYGDISLFTSIEFRTTRLSSVLEVLSVCVCICTTFGLLLVQIRIILVAHKLQKAQLQAKQQNDTKLLESNKNNLKEYEIIFEGFKNNSFFQQSFLFFYYLRIYIFYSVISWLDFPLVQTLLNTSMEVIIMLYLAISRPLKSNIELVQYLVIELIFLTVNVSTLGLAVLDFYESEDEKARIGLGDAILYCNNALTYCALFFLFVSVLVMIVDVVKMIKKRGLKVKKVQRPRKVMQDHHNANVSDNNNANDNDNDVSIAELNPSNKSQFLNISHNTEGSTGIGEIKTSTSTLEERSNILVVEGFATSESKS